MTFLLMRKLTLRGELSTVTQLSPGLLSITHQLWQHRLDDLTVQGTCPWLTTYLLVYLILRSLDLGKLYTFNPFFLHRIWWMGTYSHGCQYYRRINCQGLVCIWHTQVDQSILAVIMILSSHCQYKALRSDWKHWACVVRAWVQGRPQEA